MRASFRAAAFAVAVVLLAFAAASPASAASFLWKKQLGTVVDDYVHFVGGDAEGNVVIAYQSYAAPEFVTPVYAIIKYDPSGKQLWRRNQSGGFYGLSLDSAGNVYVVAGTPRSGPFIIKYTSDGNVVWRRTAKTKYGYPNNFVVDHLGHPVSIFGGGSVSSEFYVVHYATDGRIDWTKMVVLADATRLQIGGVTTDSDGNVVVSGITTGTTPQDYFDDKLWIAKWTNGGAPIFLNVFDNISLASSPNLYVGGVSTDGADNIVLAGWAYGYIPERPWQCDGAYCAFLAKFDPDGSPIWTNVRRVASLKSPYPTHGNSLAKNVTIDATGTITVSGVREVFPDPTVYFWWIRPWVAKYDSDGTLLWEWYWPLGTGLSNAPGVAAGIAVDALGDIAIGGYTDGPLAGAYKGVPGSHYYDGFVAKLKP